MSLRLLYPSDGKFLFLLACFLSFNHTENDTWYDDEDDNDNNIFFLEYFLWWPVLQQHWADAVGVGRRSRSNNEISMWVWSFSFISQQNRVYIAKLLQPLIG